MKIKYYGKVLGVFINQAPKSMISTAQEEIKLVFEGIVGDKHFGMKKLSDGRTPWYPRNTEICNVRQISLISEEEINEIAQAMEMNFIKPEWIGTNLIVSGVENFTQIPPSSRIFFEGGAVIKVEEKNAPCSFAGASILQESKSDNQKIKSLFPFHAKEKRGLVGTTEKEGIIFKGESFHVRIPL